MAFKNNGLFVNIVVNGATAKFLVDTGCGPTILNSQFYEKMCSCTKPQLSQNVTSKLKVADGRPIPYKGTGTFKMTIVDVMTVEHEMLVADIDVEGLLGYDFLSKHNCQINTRKGELDFGDKTNEKMPIKDVKEDVSCYRVSVTETTIIPPNSEQLVKARLSCKPRSATMGVIEPRETFLERYPLMLAKVLVDPQRDFIPIRIMNPTSDPITIMKKTIVGTCEEVIEVIDESNDCTSNCNTISNHNEKDEVTSNHVEHMMTHNCTPTVTQNCVDEVTQSVTQNCVPPHLQDLWQRSCEGLNPVERTRVASLLAKYSDVFVKSPDDLGRTNLVEHHINTGNAAPIKQAARRKPIHMRDKEREHVEDLLRRGLIKESESPWSSPTVLTRKKNGETRFCVDYRLINEKTIKDNFPLPNINDSLDTLSEGTYFSVLDMASGYWQVPVSAEDKPKTAFVCESGLFEWNVLPYGLCNAPACFERLVEKVLAGLQWQSCLLYIDDIVCFGKTFNHAVDRLDEIFLRMRNANLKFGPKKCHLFQASVNYLGHVVSKEGVSTDPAKIEAVQKWPAPQTVSEVRSWLGFTSYYRRFMRGYSEMAAPLFALTEKSRTFGWTAKCEEAFTKMKNALITAPILAYPTVDGQYVLDCDASDVGIGAVLSIVQEGSLERPIAYFSKTLSKSEKRYCVTRKELYALVAGVKHFHHYLYGRKFLIRTDHSALRWLMNFKNPEGQTARWIEVLGTYDFEIKHRPGKLHQNADGLSRIPCRDCKQCDKISQNADSASPMSIMRQGKCHHEETHGEDDGEEFEITLGSTTLPPSAMAVNVITTEQSDIGDNEDDDEEVTNSDNLNENAESTASSWAPQWSANDLREAQMEDPCVSKIIRWMETSQERPEWKDISSDDTTLKVYWSHWDQLKLVNNVLYKRWVSNWGSNATLKLVVPRKLRQIVFDGLHASRVAGHLGETKTMGRVGERYWWAKWRDDVIRRCKACDMCASRKPPHKTPRAPMQTYNVGAPLERIAIDVMGPLPTSDRGNKYILVVGDYFTKWMEAYAMPNQEAKTVATVIAEEFICRFGVPRQLHSDQGRNFESHLFTELCEILSIDKTRTTPLHPCSDGMIERMNRSLEAMLSMFVSKNQRDWDAHLPFMMMAYRSASHESTKCTPNEMMLGRNAELPIDILFGSPPANSSLVKVSKYVEDLSERLELVHKYAREKLNVSSEKQKRNYDHRADKKPPYERGDAVWLFNPHRKKGITPKFDLPWEGPFLVLERLSDVTFRIQRTCRSVPKVVHYNRLKKYRGEGFESWLKTPVESDHSDHDVRNNIAQKPSLETIEEEDTEGELVDDAAETQPDDEPLVEPDDSSEEMSSTMTEELENLEKVTQDSMTFPEDGPLEDESDIVVRERSEDTLVSDETTVPPPVVNVKNSPVGTRKSTRQRKLPKKLQDYILEGEEDDSEIPIWV